MDEVQITDKLCYNRHITIDSLFGLPCMNMGEDDIIQILKPTVGKTRPGNLVDAMPCTMQPLGGKGVPLTD